MAVCGHARLKNEFVEDEKYHNLMSWLILSVLDVSIDSVFLAVTCDCGTS